MMSQPKTESGSEWASRFFRDADTLELDRLTAWFADDIELRFANNPPLNGKAAVAAAMGDFYGTISGMQHQPTSAVSDGTAVAQQAIVTYSTAAGREIALPVSSYLHRTEAGKIDKLWIYIDIAPLYAPAAV